MIGDNIKRLMKESGYTQKQLAMRSGCTECSISRYINNEREPNIKTLKKLAISFGVTVDELLEDCEAMNRCGDCIHYPTCKNTAIGVRMNYCPRCGAKMDVSKKVNNH